MSTTDIECLRPVAPASFTLKEKRSEFIASLFPASNQAEAKARLDLVRKEHFSATHNCPAWRTEFPNTVEFCSDDGEPSGTAGRPILGVLQKYAVCNAVLVVTRYFGGVKLGVRGLIDAYSLAAEGAVKRAHLETAVPLLPVTLKCDYTNLASLNHIIKSCGVLPQRIKTAYAENVTMEVLATPKCEEALKSALSSYEAKLLTLSLPIWGSGKILAGKIKGEK